MNRCLQEAHVPKWMTKGESTLIQTEPLKKPPKLQNHKVPTYDAENTNSTNKGSDLLLTNKSLIVPGGTERMDPETQESYSILIWTSSTRARPDRKI